MYRFNREMRVRIILLLIYRPLFFAAGLYTPLGTGRGGDLTTARFSASSLAR